MPETPIYLGLSLLFWLGGLAALCFVLGFLLYRSGLVQTRRRGLSRLGSLAATGLGGLCLALFVVEIGFRLAVPGGYLSAPLREVALGPAAQTEPLPDGNAYWEYRDMMGFDKDGYRPSPEPPTPGDLRILLLGDSVTYGVNVPFDLSFTGLIRTALAERCRKAVLTNLAVTGYNTAQELASFRRKGIPFAPHLVVIGVFANDYARMTVIGNAAYDLRVKNIDGRPSFHFLPLPARASAWLLYHSVFFQYFTLRGMALSDLVTGRRLTELDLALDELEQLRQLCQGIGAQLAILLFPPLGQSLSLPEDRWTATLFDRVRQWAADRQLPLLDFRPALAGDDLEAIRLDLCCHFSVVGHQAVARELLPFLEKLPVVREHCAGGQ